MNNNSPLLGCRVEHKEDSLQSSVVQFVYTDADNEPCMTLLRDNGELVTTWLGGGWRVIEEGPAADTTTDTNTITTNSASFTPDQTDIIIAGLLQLARAQSSMAESKAIDKRIDELIEGIDGAQVSMSGPEVDPAVIEPILAALGD